MHRVILESPFAGDVDGNIAYARECVRDCLHRNEAPIASHLLFTQPGILRDDVPTERELGIRAGLVWADAAERVVFYLDRGMSNGMAFAMNNAVGHRKPVEFRYRGTGGDIDVRDLQWEQDLAHMPERESWHADTIRGRLDVHRHMRAPNEAAPIVFRFMDKIVAFYTSVAAAKVGAVAWYKADMPAPPAYNV